MSEPLGASAPADGDVSAARTTHVTAITGRRASASTEVRAAVALLRAFARRGVRVAYGIPGGAISPVFDALAECPEIEYVPTRHEAMAVFAALGHARVTGLPALVLTTAGPGVTNAVTGLAAALAEEIPVIMLAGDAPRSSAGRAAFQEGTIAGLDVVSLMRPVTRWSSVVLGPSMASGLAARAFTLATSSPAGPVFISVPFDVAEGATSDLSIACAPAAATAPDGVACTEAAHRLSRAAQPLLVLGNGARGAGREIRRLSERLSIPVVVTGHAKGIYPERHPLYLGIIGHAGHPSAIEYLDLRPDVVCVIGSRLGDFATSGWTFSLAGTRDTIQIDRDPWLIGRNAPVTLGIVGDARLATSAILQALDPSERRPIPLLGGCRSYEPAPTEEGGLGPRAVLAALSAAFPEAVWCSDIGEHMGMAQHYLRVDSADQFLCFSGLASMGSGMGAAIGLKRAAPSRTVVSIVGDGGFNMHAGELLTCVEQGIGVVFAVFNDGRWNMVDHGFRSVFGRKPPNLPRKVPDLAAVARGYGAEAEVIRRCAELDPARLSLLHRPARPLVLDIRVDPSECLSVRSRSAALKRGAR